MPTLAVGSLLVATVDDCDYQAAAYHLWHPSRGRHTVYAVAHLPGSSAMVRLHVLVAQRMGADSTQVDHRDGNGLNCQRANLRPATHSQNQANTDKRSGRSHYKGVAWSKSHGKWQAKITVAYQQRHLGFYATEEEAAMAYNDAAMAAWGEYARLNEL